MIWEVDDDCDKTVSWAEFQAMFTRCRNDKSGAQGARRARQAALSVQCALVGVIQRVNAWQDSSHGDFIMWSSS